MAGLRGNLTACMRIKEISINQQPFIIYVTKLTIPETTRESKSVTNSPSEGIPSVCTGAETPRFAALNSQSDAGIHTCIGRL